MRLFAFIYNTTIPVTILINVLSYTKLNLVENKDLFQIIISSAIYLLGYVLCYSMLKIDHESEKETFTKGDRVITIFLSLLSLFMIMFILITTWINKINTTGYWQRPSKQKDE